jgi:hypothetical protein
MPHKKKNQQTSKHPKPQKTVPCQACGEAIKIPDQCQHGKKLANCQGTNCITAHITDHKNVCTLLVTRHQAEIQTSKQPSLQKEHAVLSELVKQELQNIEKIRGKDFQYLKGIPRAEALNRIEWMGLEELRGLAEQLKSVSDGKTTADEAMYDDEDSGDEDNMRCPTPPEDE